MESSKSPPIVRFGIYEADLAAGELRKNGLKVKLQGKPFEIMTLLLEHPGEVVSREQLHKRLWPADTFVDFDHGLNNAMNKLRYALGDSADNSRFIATVGGRGYRFIAPVERGIQELAPPVALPEVALPAKPVRAARRAWMAGSSALALLIILVFVIFFRGNVGTWVRQLTPGSGPGRIQSLAVLPLENLSNNPEEQYFADGMTDELTTELAAIGSLRVISRTSVMHYRKTTKTLPQIGRELSVDAIVEGSVVHSGNRVRINSQWIETATDHHPWAKTYDRDTHDTLAMQSEVAQAIASAVRIKLTPREQARFSGQRHVIPEAHEAYLKGRYCLDSETEEGLGKAKNFFNAALQLDPGYALAWAGLADSYYYLSDIYLPPVQAMPAAKAAAERAVAIDDSLASAHTSLALVRLFYDRDLPAAERELRRAIELNPNDAAAHLWYGMYFAVRQRPKESLPELRLALQLDPLSPQTRTNAGLALYLLRDYEQLVAQSLESIQLDPNSWGAHANLGGAYEQTGKFAEAISEWSKASELSGSPVMLSGLGHAYASAGKQTEARKVLGQLKKLSEQRFVPAWAMAAVYVGLGDKEQALIWLERAYQDKSECFIELKADAMFDPLRSDPRFVNLLRRVGLEE
jgi:TolB-like protein/DNA-binding winged helix-turn-helix (wHTH) protein/tetratricopeptide (TPR) repeat protein